MSLDLCEQVNCDKLQAKSQQCYRRLDQYVTKNVLIISLCCMLLFTAFNGLQSLQSSLHTEEGLGLAYISVLYARLAITGLLGVAPFIISKIGYKWSSVDATWYTMIPAAILVGLGAGPLWVAKAAYLTVTATNVASQGEEDMEVITHRYFGVFFFMFAFGKTYSPPSGIMPWILTTFPLE